MKESNKKVAAIIGFSLYNFLKRLKFRLIYYSYFSSLLNGEKNIAENRRKFYSLFINSGDLCYDIGANIGNRIIPLLTVGANVVAVEPQFLCAKFLKHYFNNKIILVEKALGKFEGKAVMQICDESTISSMSYEWISAVKKERFKDNYWDRTQYVSVTTLDKLITQYEKPKFIKIDVEGYELEVLQGLSESIPLISYEYTVPELLDKAVACLLEFKRINPIVECNYCVRETTVFELDDWLSIDRMLDHMNTEKFIGTEFGDIYVKEPNLKKS